jgi:KTSC domain-containing protein
MERISVTSSTMTAIGYDPNSHALEIEFNSGAVYQYGSVPQSEYDGLMSAESKGKYFNSYIKDRYAYAKL